MLVYNSKCTSGFLKHIFCCINSNLMENNTKKYAHSKLIRTRWILIRLLLMWEDCPRPILHLFGHFEGGSDVATFSPWKKIRIKHFFDKIAQNVAKALYNKKPQICSIHVQYKTTGNECSYKTCCFIKEKLWVYDMRVQQKTWSIIHGEIVHDGKATLSQNPFS